MKNENKWALEFISKSLEVHEGFYDYSLVDYKTARTPVKIICPVHGVFEQVPDAHKHGSGCKLCYGNVTPTTDEFIKNMRVVHGDKYDYSQTEYGNNAHEKVKVICKQHGEFWVTPANHRKGKGCKKCGSVVGRAKQKLSIKKYYEAVKSNISISEAMKSQFIEKAVAKYGYKYDYSLVKYINANTNVTIVCPVHGEFQQTPSTHLCDKSLFGCRKCGRLAAAKNRSASVSDSYFTKFVGWFGDLYDYSKYEYVTAKTKSVIICRKHGEFLVSPDNHSRGKGCPTCAKSGFDVRKDAVFYVYVCKDYNFVGYGITTNFKQRNSCHKKNFNRFGMQAKLLATFEGKGIVIQNLERKVKQIFKDSRHTSGVEGFVWESTTYENLPMLLEVVSNELTTTSGL